MEYKFPRLRKILADGGYQGTPGDWVTDKFGWVVEVVLRPDERPGRFRVLPKRWIVERTFSWLENFRRLTIDYEYLAETAEAMIQLASVQIMLNKFLYDFKIAFYRIWLELPPVFLYGVYVLLTTIFVNLIYLNNI